MFTLQYHKFRRKLTKDPNDIEPAIRLLKKIENLKFSNNARDLCCYKADHLDQIAECFQTGCAVTICTGCYHNLKGHLKGKKKCDVKMLPELLLEAIS